MISASILPLALSILQEVSHERLKEAQETRATITTSTYPFCQRNISDANGKYNFNFEVLDLKEIIDQIDIETLE